MTPEHYATIVLTTVHVFSLKLYYAEHAGSLSVYIMPDSYFVISIFNPFEQLLLNIRIISVKIQKYHFASIVSIFHNPITSHPKVVSLSNFEGIFPSGNWRWISFYITCELLAVMQYCNKFNIITRLCSDDDNNLFIYLTWRCPSISNWILCCYAMLWILCK